MLNVSLYPVVWQGCAYALVAECGGIIDCKGWFSYALAFAFMLPPALALALSLAPSPYESNKEKKKHSISKFEFYFIFFKTVRMTNITFM